MVRHTSAAERREKVAARLAARSRRTATKATARHAAAALTAALAALAAAQTEGGQGRPHLAAAAAAVAALGPASAAAADAADAAASAGLAGAARRLRAASAEAVAEAEAAAPFVRTCGGPRCGGMWYELAEGPKRYPARCQGDAGLDLLMAGCEGITPAQASAAASEWRRRYPDAADPMGGAGFKQWAAGAHAAAWAAAAE